MSFCECFATGAVCEPLGAIGAVELQLLFQMGLLMLQFVLLQLEGLEAEATGQDVLLAVDFLGVI